MKHVCAALLAVFLLSTAASADNADLTLADKAAMQAAMQRHVDGQSVDGGILYLDRETGEVHTLHPVTAHPMILAMQPHFVLCFDFRDDAGREVPVDYYMTRNGSSYTVFHTAVADRGLLGRLMESGRVQRLK